MAAHQPVQAPAARRPSAPSGATKRRYRLLWLATIGMVMCYLDRANLAVALPFMDEDLDLNLSNAEKGIIFGAFFWAYDGAMLFAGWFADRVGSRRAFTLAAVWWSIFTMLTAAVRGFWSLFAARFALGLGEAPAYPAGTKMISRWFPTHERTFAAAVFDSGARAGTVLSLPVVTALVAAVHWQFSFLFLGVVGLLWAAIWFWYYRDPKDHQGANDLERDYIREHGARVEENDHSEASQIKWATLFRYRTVRGMMLGFFCLNFVIYFFLTWFPTYLLEARNLDLVQLGTLGMLPGFGAIVMGWTAGFVADRFVTRGTDVTKVRKTIIVSGMLGGSVILLAAIVTQTWLALVFLGLCYGSLSAAASGIWSLPADVAPSSRHVASIGGIQNFASNIAGIISPFVIGLLLDLYDGSYVPAFAVAAGVAVAGAATYAFVVGRAEPLPLLPPRARSAHADVT